MNRSSTPPHGTPVSHCIRVVIADDHAILRDGLRALVQAEPAIEVVGEAATADEAWRQACALTPDVLVLDLSMPGASGAEAAERILADCPEVRIIALTMHEERGYVARCLRAGAAGYVLKRTASAELVRAIRTVAAGGTYIDPSLAGALLGAQAMRAQRTATGSRTPELGALSAREAEVLRLVARGHSNKEIASALQISVKTVETHKTNGMVKLGLKNRAALVRFAIDDGWLGERRS